MIYKILADTIVVVHFGWILFMLIGFILTLYGLLFWKEFFNKWLIRTLHLIGIVYVSTLYIMGKDCPLTVLENILRAKSGSSLTYPGSFMIHYVRELVYPNVNLSLVIIPTAFIAIFTMAIFITKPPVKIKNVQLRWSSHFTDVSKRPIKTQKN